MDFQIIIFHPAKQTKNKTKTKQNKNELVSNRIQGSNNC